MARNPHKQGGLATPPPELDDDAPAAPPAGAPVDDEDQGGAGDDSADDAPARPASRSGGPAGRVVDGGAGWVLGLIIWGGVVLPFIKHGPDGVKAWWLAKFLNKAPDGSELP
jgi:hypothetical protein